MKFFIFSFMMMTLIKNMSMFLLILLFNFFLLILNFKFLFNMKFMLILIFLFMFILISYFKMSMLNYNAFFIPMKMILLSLMMSFMFMISNNLYMFFMFFELSIIPIYMYMVFFSLTEKKIISSFYLIIYTSIFSFIFIMIMIMEFKINKTNSLYMFFMMLYNMNMFKMMMMLMMLTKIPVFMLHIWLPKAHVESSTLGSMMLAGILLKLGGIGLILFMNINFNLLLKMLMLNFLMFSSIYILIMCFMKNDLKMIIAYFSISHMSLVVIPLILNMFFSMFFSMMMMVAHSISSPMLFFFMMALYKNFSSRLIMKINNMFNFSNSLSWIMFIFLMYNISIPPSMNFFSELLIFFMLMKYSNLMMAFIVTLVLMSGLISILMIIKMMMGKEKFINSYNYVMNINFMSINYMFLLISFLFLMKIYMN